MTEGPVLVTGAAGFIGFHIAQRLLCNGCDVIGVDNMNDYYDPTLKESRRTELAKSNQMRFVRLDLADREGVARLFKEYRFPCVVHLAAQAGVRHCCPFAYLPHPQDPNTDHPLRRVSSRRMPVEKSQ